MVDILRSQEDEEGLDVSGRFQSERGASLIIDGSSRLNGLDDWLEWGSDCGLSIPRPVTVCLCNSGAPTVLRRSEGLMAAFEVTLCIEVGRIAGAVEDLVPGREESPSPGAFLLFEGGLGKGVCSCRPKARPVTAIPTVPKAQSCSHHNISMVRTVGKSG